MSRTDIPVFSSRLELADAPIDPSWVLAGTPRARNRILWNSSDKMGFCMLWDCTAGTFNWIYDFDEVVQVVEGGVIVTGPDGIAKRLGPGDVALFPQGVTMQWHVEDYVRKVAWCQHQLPEAVAMPIRAWRKLKAMFARSVQKADAAAGVRVHA